MSVKLDLELLRNTYVQPPNRIKVVTTFSERRIFLAKGHWKLKTFFFKLNFLLHCRTEILNRKFLFFKGNKLFLCRKCRFWHLRFFEFCCQWWRWRQHNFVSFIFSRFAPITYMQPKPLKKLLNFWAIFKFSLVFPGLFDDIFVLGLFLEEVIQLKNQFEVCVFHV